VTGSTTIVRLEDELGAVVTLDEVEDQDGQGSVRFRIGLRAGGLQAEATVSSYESPEEGLGAFLEDLAGRWRGWEGTRTWDAGRSLGVDAHHDARGYARLRFTLHERGEVDRWTASIEVRLAGGEELSAAAAAVASLLRPPVTSRSRTR
jgi:hypothetical protein